MGILREIVIQSCLGLLAMGGLVAIAMGIAMLLKPERVAALNAYCSRWIGTPRIREHLDRPRWIERYFYRHHRLVGSFLLIGSFFILYVFLFGYRLHIFSASLPPATRGLWIVLTAILLVGGVIGALVGFIVLVRPSLLRDIEKASNRWVSTDGLTRFFDGMSDSVDRSVLRHSKAAGLFMVAGGMYVLVVLGQLLLRGGWRF